MTSSTRSTQFLLAPQVRLVLALIMILAEGFSAVVNTSTTGRVIDLVVVVVGILMAADSLHQMRTHASGSAARR